MQMTGLTIDKLSVEPENAVSKSACLERAGYSVREFAAMFGVSEQMVRGGIKSGQIAIIHFGRRHVIPRAEVDRLAHTV